MGTTEVIMPLRAFLNRHPVATVGVVVVLIALAVVSIVYQLRLPSDVAQHTCVPSGYGLPILG